MSTNETRNQDSTAIVVIGDDIEVIDGTPDWEEPLIEYDRYGEPIGHNRARYPICGAEVLDGETSTAFHRSTCRYK